MRRADSRPLWNPLLASYARESLLEKGRARDRSVRKILTKIDATCNLGSCFLIASRLIFTFVPSFYEFRVVNELTGDFFFENIRLTVEVSRVVFVFHFGRRFSDPPYVG